MLTKRPVVGPNQVLSSGYGRRAVRLLGGSNETYLSAINFISATGVCTGGWRANCY